MANKLRKLLFPVAVVASSLYFNPPAPQNKENREENSISIEQIISAQEKKPFETRPAYPEVASFLGTSSTNLIKTAIGTGIAIYRYSAENLPSLPTNYRVSQKSSGKPLPITINQILEREKTSEEDSLLPQFISISSKNSNPESWEHLIIYSTAIGNAQDPNALRDKDGKPNTWCHYCNILDERNTYERIQTKIPESIGLIRILHPPSKLRPSYFEIVGFEGVPATRIFRKENKTLEEIATISAPSAEAYADEVIRTLNQIIEGKLKEIVLKPEDFRNLKVHYETTPEAMQDHLAIATAKALFPERVFSEDTQTYIVTLDLSDPRQYAFALDTNSSKKLMQDKGRNIFPDITKQTIIAGCNAQEENFSARINGLVVDFLSRVRSEMPDSFLYAARHRLAFDSFFAFSQQFVPPYIKPFHEGFVAASQAQFLGESDNYTIIEDLTSPGVLRVLEQWAKENNKTLEKKLFQQEENENISHTIQRTRDALAFLKERGIEYAHFAPKPVLEQLIRETPYAVIRISREPFIQDINEIENWQENPTLDGKSPFSLSTLIAISEQITDSDKKNITLLALPYVNTRVGFTETPRGSVTRLVDGLSGDPDTPALCVLKGGRYHYTIFGINSAQEAAENIIRKIKQ